MTFCDQLPVSLLAQLVERCNGIAEVRGHALSKIGWFKRSIHHDLNTSCNNIDCNLYRGRLYEEKSGRDQYDRTNTILIVIFIATMSNYNTLSIKKKKGRNSFLTIKTLRDWLARSMCWRDHLAPWTVSSVRGWIFEEETGRNQYYMTVNIVSMTKPLT